MDVKIKTTSEQREKLCNLICQDRIVEAEAIVHFLGHNEGINAHFFEQMIKEDGLTMVWIKAISIYYADELKRMSQ